MQAKEDRLRKGKGMGEEKRSEDGAVPVVLEAATARLRAAAYCGLRQVELEWHDGILTLRGPVPSYTVKQLAQARLQGLVGVEAIENRLDAMTPVSKHQGHL